MKTLALISIFALLHSEPGKLENFKKTINNLKLSSSECFKEIMVEHKHKSHFLLPSHLLSFMENFKPFRMSFSNAIDLKDNKLRLTWFFSEYALDGDNDENMKSIKALLVKDGFEEKEIEGDYSLKYLKSGKLFNTQVIFDDLVNYEGGKEEKCGGTLIYIIEVNKPVQSPLISEALEILPSLKFESFPKTIYDFISSQKFSSINYGGTWERYYTWSVSIPYSIKEKMKVDLDTIKESLEKEGYEVKDNDDNNFTYRSTGQKGSSWFYISIEENTLELRFQPNS